MDTTKTKAAALDARAKTALNNALDDLLPDLVALDQQPDIFEGYRAMDSFLKALTKHEPWRSHIRFFDLFETLSFFIKKYEVTADPGAGIKVADALSANRYREFRNDLRAYLFSIPRHYQLTVELPSMPRWGAGELRLTKRLSLVEVPSQSGATRLADIASGLGLAKLPAPVSARVDGFGYGAGRLDTTAVADAISHLKQFFHLFKRIEPYESASPTLAVALGDTKIRCEVIDVEYADEHLTVELPERLRRFLWTVSIDETKLKHFDTSGGAATLLDGGRDAKTRDEKVSALMDKAGWITRLMDCPPEWPDAERIRTAVEWSFDSQQNDNETFAFIQACIGLEALIGDDSKDEPLTARLADRCAYLLGKGHKDRARIRERFKDMYDVRSKLIHGRSPRLNLPDSEQLHFAQTVLGDVITTEANALLRALADAEKKRAGQGRGISDLEKPEN